MSRTDSCRRWYKRFQSNATEQLKSRVPEMRTKLFRGHTTSLKSGSGVRERACNWLAIESGRRRHNAAFPKKLPNPADQIRRRKRLLNKWDFRIQTAFTGNDIGGIAGHTAETLSGKGFKCMRRCDHGEPRSFLA